MDSELVGVLVDGEMIAVVAVDFEVVGLLLDKSDGCGSKMMGELGCWLR